MSASLHQRIPLVDHHVLAFVRNRHHGRGARSEMRHMCGERLLDSALMRLVRGGMLRRIGPGWYSVTSRGMRA